MKFVFRKATKKDIPVLGRMMREVWEAMKQKEWFAQYDAEKYITDLFNTRKGDVWQATDPITRQVAGIFIATYPGRGNENLGYDIGLPDPELSLVAHMDTIVVHPLYRGQGLQQKLTALAEQDLRSRGFRYFMCTIHPDNKYSKDNMEIQNYKVLKEDLRYRGLTRRILLKKFALPWSPEKQENHP